MSFSILDWFKKTPAPKLAPLTEKENRIGSSSYLNKPKKRAKIKPKTKK